MQFEQLAFELPDHLRKLAAMDNLPTAPQGLDRRKFLKLTTAGGFALGAFPLGTLAQDGKKPAGLKPNDQPSAFVHIAKDGTTSITVNRLEFGQGVHTALSMILAEELDADWAKVKSEHGTNDPAYVDPVLGMHLTGGSGSIAHSYMQYRQLGARTRSMLISAAAAEWKVDASALKTRNGFVMGPDGKQQSYGELAESAMKLPVPEQVPLKDPKDFRLVGKPVDRLDSKLKSSGRQSYGIDVRLPGMLTALVAKPPVFFSKAQGCG